MPTRQIGPLAGLLRLGEADLATLQGAFAPGITAGERYPAGQMKRVGR